MITTMMTMMMMIKSAAYHTTLAEYGLPFAETLRDFRGRIASYFESVFVANTNLVKKYTYLGVFKV